MMDLIETGTRVRSKDLIAFERYVQNLSFYKLITK